METVDIVGEACEMCGRPADGYFYNIRVLMPVLDEHGAWWKRNEVVGNPHYRCSEHRRVGQTTTSPFDNEVWEYMNEQANYDPETERWYKKQKFGGMVREIVYAKRQGHITTTITGPPVVNFGLLEPAQMILEIDDGDNPEVMHMMRSLMDGKQYTIEFTQKDV